MTIFCPLKRILAHPNVKVFVTRGKLEGVMAAIYAGVPILGLPWEMEEMAMMLRVKDLAIGDYVDLSDDPKEIFSQMIRFADKESDEA